MLLLLLVGRRASAIHRRCAAAGEDRPLPLSHFVSALANSRAPRFIKLWPAHSVEDDAIQDSCRLTLLRNVGSSQHSRRTKAGSQPQESEVSNPVPFRCCPPKESRRGHSTTMLLPQMLRRAAASTVCRPRTLAAALSTSSAWKAGATDRPPDRSIQVYEIITHPSTHLPPHTYQQTVPSSPASRGRRRPR